MVQYVQYSTVQSSSAVQSSPVQGTAAGICIVVSYFVYLVGLRLEGGTRERLRPGLVRRISRPGSHSSLTHSLSLSLSHPAVNNSNQNIPRTHPRWLAGTNRRYEEQPLRQASKAPCTPDSLHAISIDRIALQAFNFSPPGCTFAIRHKRQIQRRTAKTYISTRQFLHRHKRHVIIIIVLAFKALPVDPLVGDECSRLLVPFVHDTAKQPAKTSLTHAPPTHEHSLPPPPPRLFYSGVARPSRRNPSHHLIVTSLSPSSFITFVPILNQLSLPLLRSRRHARTSLIHQHFGFRRISLFQRWKRKQLGQGDLGVTHRKDTPLLLIRKGSVNDDEFDLGQTQCT